jgi:hypothetical protein
LGRSGMKWLVGVLAAAACVALSVATTAPGLAERRALQTSSGRFGVYAWHANNGIPPIQVSRAKQMGVTTAQLLVDWRRIEFTEGYNDAYTNVRGGFDWTAITPVDESLAAVAGAGMKPILLVANPPDWALTTPGTQGPLRSDKVDDYVSFVRRLVERYAGAPYYVEHIVLWPEPDARQFGASGCGSNQLHSGWGDRPTEFVQMLQRAYPAVKAAAPSVQVVLGALAYDNWCGANTPGFNSGSNGLFNYRFLDDVIAGGGASFFDAFAFNAYLIYAPGWEQQAAGYDVAAKVGYIRERFPSLSSKSALVLESGIWSDASVAVPVRMPDGSIGTVVPNEMWQAGYPAKLFSRGLSANLATVLWYGLVDAPGDVQRGMLSQSGGEKPSFFGFKQAVLRLGSVTYLSPVQARDVSGGTVEGYVFGTQAGGRTAVLWAVGDLAANATATVDLPGGNLRGYDVFGNRIPDLQVNGEAARVTVGHQPVYLMSGREELRGFVPLGPRNTASP